MAIHFETSGFFIAAKSCDEANGCIYYFINLCFIIIIIIKYLPKIFIFPIYFKWRPPPRGTSVTGCTSHYVNLPSHVARRSPLGHWQFMRSETWLYDENTDANWVGQWLNCNRKSLWECGCLYGLKPTFGCTFNISSEERLDGTLILRLLVYSSILRRMNAEEEISIGFNTFSTWVIRICIVIPNTLYDHHLLNVPRTCLSAPPNEMSGGFLSRYANHPPIPPVSHYSSDHSITIGHISTLVVFRFQLKPIN